MKHSRSSLFLMEMIIAIFFFSLTSAVCIQLFARSHLLSQQTVDQNHAVLQAQNLAEGFLATEGDLAQMKKLFPECSAGNPENTLLLLFDGEWKECGPEQARYAACLLSYCDNEDLIAADISVISLDPLQDFDAADPEASQLLSCLTASVNGSGAMTSSDSGAVIYTLTITHHIPERRGNLEN